MLRKIGLLVWKNLLLRRRHYIVTSLEILFPTSLFLFVVVLLAVYGGGGRGNISYEIPAEYYNVIEENELIEKLKYQLRCETDSCFVAYAPDNDRTNQVMQSMANTLSISVEWKAYQSEKTIMELMASADLNKTIKKSFMAAIIFESDLQPGEKTIEYKIRIVDQFNDVYLDADRTDTGLLFPLSQKPGPDNEHETMYEYSGFSGFQVCLDRILVKLITGSDFPQKLSLQAFPYPPYKYSGYDLSSLLSNLIVLGFIFMVPSIIRVVVSEKETGIKELLKLNGLPGCVQLLGWMINSMLIMIITITIVVFLLFCPFSKAGAAIVYSDPTLWWFIMFLYIMSASSFCLFISSFFKRPTIAMIVGMILWLTSFYYPWTKLTNNYRMWSFGDKIGVALLPNMALYLATKVMSAFDAKAVGLQWSNIAEPLTSIDALSLGYVILMFLVNTTMYMLLTAYIESVLPSDYGVRKPWYFIFQPAIWRQCCSCFCSSRKYARVVRRPASSVHDDINLPGFEAQLPDAIVGVEIKNLQKSFGKNKVAVAGVSTKMYDGEIYALLGHNGAGKTTIISVLTGLYAPSGGTATINGYDINTELDIARQNMGLCPQHNMLFDKLTVLEQLRFFGQLKGLTSKQAVKESNELVQKLKFFEKKNTLSRALSGGQKRKLSLGIALIGGTKVVILDEPTSGMDPEARRVVWDMLLEMRGNRTILLTTHFMEEADVLGDRIGIMASGKLQCCGTSMFLKKYYGTGYTLKLTISSTGKQSVILTAIQKHVADASIKSMFTTNSSELLVTLPTETTTTSVLSALFDDLTANKDTLGIETVGLSQTTMDEVFVRVGELSEDFANGKGTKSAQSTSKIADDKISLKQNRNRVRGLALIYEQFIGLFIKKGICTIRKWKLMLSHFIMPIILLILAILVANSTFKTPPQPPPLKISLDSYKNPITLYSAPDDTSGNLLREVIGLSAKAVRSGSTISDVLVKRGKTDLAAYRERYIVGSELTATKLNAMFNTIPNHAAALSLNLATNALLKILAPTEDHKIVVTNHPLQSTAAAIIEAAKPNPEFRIYVSITFAVFMPMGLALLAASFIVFPIEEKLCKAKQLQLMTGVNPLIYWASSFVWDFCAVALVVGAMTACFPIFEAHRVFTSYGGAGVAFLILLVYGYSAISFSYLISLYSQTVTGGFALVALLHVISGLILSLIVYGLELVGFLPVASIVRSVGRLFPTFSAAISTVRFSEVATINGKCNILSNEAKKLLCDPSNDVPREYRECCGNCYKHGWPCFKPIRYIKWKYEKYDIFRNKTTVPGIGQDLFFMILLALIYQTLLILLELGLVRKVTSRIFKTNKSVFQADVIDPDVDEEARRVANMSSADMNEEALVVIDLCKSYGTFAAVSKLSFGVHHGECFGLLGVNGAGKTTAFRMLTGDEFMSCGSAYALKNSLEKNKKKFVSNIGYCPQFDGIIGVLSGKEMLQLFCRLRGIPGRNGKIEAEKWLSKLGLSESANVQCQKYSGGMKRRLSAAMALVGDPPLILLDEPTSGVDPVSRRQFWKVLESVKNSGQAIILTSHSMEECEALCSRLGIMVNGQLQCLGGVQHLKNKYAQGYSVTLRLKPNVPVDSTEVDTLNTEITQKFDPCTLKDKHQSILQYQLHNASIPWNELFKSMEDIKTSYEEMIEDYSVNETTLEDVFLSFARKQYGNRKANVSLLKRICTCQCCSS